MNLHGTAADYALVFLGGVGLSFNPCLYPLLPVTASIIGINAGVSRMRSILLSFTYVTGIAVIYTVLGLLAVMGGSVFGSITQHPMTKVIIGLIFLVFGLSILGVLSFRTINISNPFTIRQTGIPHIFALGLSSGLIISPCVSPVLGAILLYVSTTRNVVYGATLLMTFAYGMGLLLILVGSSASLLHKLPHSGRWMKRLQKFSGLILLCVGVYSIVVGIHEWWLLRMG